MAYRITVPRERIEQLNDPFWNNAIVNVAPRVWVGPGCHAILYPVRSGAIWNVVLCCPDTLPPTVPQDVADIKDMVGAFKGWDPKLRLILETVKYCLKWKICQIEEIERWTRGYVAVMGDACHSSLPYQGQGAAMALEDGAVLGVLLGALSTSSLDSPRSKNPFHSRIVSNTEKEQGRVAGQRSNRNASFT